MALTCEYPANWTELATEIKRLLSQTASRSVGYHCNRCGLKCLPPAHSYRHLDLSLRVATHNTKWLRPQSSQF